MVAASQLSFLLLALAIAIAAKPVLFEKNSPMRLLLMKRRSLSKYDIVELDRRRLILVGGAWTALTSIQLLLQLLLLVELVTQAMYRLLTK